MTEDPIIQIRAQDGTVTAEGTMSEFRVALDQIKAADRKLRGAPPVKNTPEDKHVEDQAYGVAADELRQFIERFEQLEAEKKDAAERQKEVMAEAKARGYDTKVMKKIVALRKRNRDDIAEEEAIEEMYRAALGMA